MAISASCGTVPQASLQLLLDQAGAEVEEGPVERDRAAARRPASSVYVRDPDGNLLEFMTYVEESAHAS